MQDPLPVTPSGPSVASREPWPVVLVHGTRTSHSQWDLQVPALRAAGHTVHTPDLPGHGARVAETFTLAAARDTIGASLRQAATADAGRGRGTAPVHLVGSSLGGMIAVHAAAGAPEHLGSLTLSGAAVQPTPVTARAYGRAIGLADALIGSGRSPWLLRALLGAEGSRAYLRGGRAPVAVVAPALAAAAEIDLLRELGRIHAPVTVLSARFDQLRLQERRFRDAAAQGHLVVLPYGTHLVNLTRPTRFTADLLTVLARAEARAR